MRTKPKQEKKTQRVRMNTKVFSLSRRRAKGPPSGSVQVSECDTSAGLGVKSSRREPYCSWCGCGRPARRLDGPSPVPLCSRPPRSRVPVYGCGQTHLMEGRSGDSDSLGELSLQDKRCCPAILPEPPRTASEGHTFPLQAFHLEVLGQFPRQGMLGPPSEPLCLPGPLGH